MRLSIGCGTMRYNITFIIKWIYLWRLKRGF